ncbi:flagellar basal body P-ring formation chaperone FlgA [Engelhardtia mirabilis]|uniref:Flagellar basal body P-ring biosynthesis protein FlgA n=1 Tax=Engelhardtia mirabilis TaxID=2528011 RepID=A0A518BSY8_9BACT|nr:flagellar basal body P-ring biosynthesis protein FlgA [Planctomycetes bacterium Pla133]QDV04408.1 flagellar basal body P-ring biosynthesis protein FlgA [Planctomycetes bacterium Pla86]
MLILASLLLSTGVTVVLPAEARVTGTQIVLGEIADVVADDAQLARAVEEVRIGYAPAPGYSRLLRNDQIGLELQKAFPDVTWTFKGQPATRIWPVVHTISADSLVAAARAELSAASIGLDVEYVLSSQLQDVRVPGLENAFRLRGALDRPTLETGGLTVPVQVLLNGEVYRTVHTTWDVKVWQELPVLARRTVAGEPLSASLFETRRVLLDPRNEGQPVPMALITGSTAARTLREGQVVTAADVHRPIAIRSGDAVFVEVVRGSVTARVIGTAIGSGSLRDKVLVRLDLSGREMLGTVESSELVRVELGLDR